MDEGIASRHRRLRPAAGRRIARSRRAGPDTVIVATTAGGETLTSRPMPRVQAEMMLLLGVRGGHGRVRSTGIIRAEIRANRDMPRTEEPLL